MNWERGDKRAFRGTMYKKMEKPNEMQGKKEDQQGCQ